MAASYGVDIWLAEVIIIIGALIALITFFGICIWAYREVKRAKAEDEAYWD